MSAACRTAAHRPMWRVLARRLSFSAFNNYKPAPSASSSITCQECGGTWRTKAAYVDQLPDIS